MDRKYRECVLISAGELHSDDRALIENFINAGAYLVAVDGGADYCRDMGIRPDLYLGDFDSVSEAEREMLDVEEAPRTGAGEKEPMIAGAGEKCGQAGNSEEEFGLPSEIIRLPAEKDDTDTLAALKICMERGFETFHVFGGLGGRLDHTLANVQCLLYLKRRGCAGYLYLAEEKLFVLKNEEIFFKKGQKGILSLFALSNTATGVQISGMKYNLEKAVLTTDFPVGISNEFTEETGRVFVEEGELLVIMRQSCLD